MKQSAAATYVRQLCALGLGAKAVMPELLRALHEIIPSHLNVFFFADRNYNLADIYSEYPGFLELSVRFLRDYVGGGDGSPGFTECMRTRYGVEANEEVYPSADFFRTDFYDAIFRSQGIHLPLQAAVRDRSGHALGRHSRLSRTQRLRYSTQEMRLMAAFLPHIAHAMQPRPDLTGGVAETETGAC